MIFRSKQLEDQEMRKKGKQQLVDCEVCDGIISPGIYMCIGDVICCEDCGTEYLVDTCEPLRLELLKEDDDNYVIRTGYDGDYGDGEYD